jgi:hypothetical protein
VKVEEGGGGVLVNGKLGNSPDGAKINTFISLVLSSTTFMSSKLEYFKKFLKLSHLLLKAKSSADYFSIAPHFCSQDSREIKMAENGFVFAIHHPSISASINSF